MIMYLLHFTITSYMQWWIHILYLYYNNTFVCVVPNKTENTLHMFQYLIPTPSTSLIKYMNVSNYIQVFYYLHLKSSPQSLLSSTQIFIWEFTKFSYQFVPVSDCVNAVAANLLNQKNTTQRMVNFEISVILVDFTRIFFFLIFLYNNKLCVMMNLIFRWHTKVRFPIEWVKRYWNVNEKEWWGHILKQVSNESCTIDIYSIMTIGARQMKISFVIKWMNDECSI